MKTRMMASFALALFGSICIANASPPPYVPTLNWVSCGPDYPDAECAIARLPLDYDDARGPTIGIALARIPAADQINKIGTVFVNPGGPGGSGAAWVLSGFGEFLGAVLQGRFDVVGFDPRGIGSSTPIRCFDDGAERGVYFQPVFPYRWDQFRPFFDLHRALANKCWSRGQQIIGHMSTADVARDLDLLREAVGDKRLTYFGVSYGSYIGNTYANMFPTRFRALAIDGVLDPGLWAGGLHIKLDRLATAEEFAEFLRLCDEAGASCAFSAPGGSAARYEALASSLRDVPLVFPNGFVYSYDYLVADSISAMYAPEVWSGYAEFFDALAEAVLGDASAVARAADSRQTIERWFKEAMPQRDDYNNSFEAYYGNQCADTEYPRSFDGFMAFGAYAEAGSFMGPYWWWYNNSCADWPVAPDRYTGPWTAHTVAPVLVVGNYFDGVTKYDGAVTTSKQLKNSRLLSYAGWGHTAFGRSTCVTEYVAEYLLNGTLPPEGTVCEANPNPFLPVAMMRRAGPAAPIIGLPPAWMMGR